MSKYESLAKYLAASNAPVVSMTFAQVEEILGAPLPISARTHRPWWANTAHGHVQARGWLSAGYQSQQVDLMGQRLTFKKLSLPSQVETEAQQAVIGWAKGTVKVPDGVDLTEPMFTDAEMDAWADTKAARIIAGLGG